REARSLCSKKTSKLIGLETPVTLVDLKGRVFEDACKRFEDPAFSFSGGLGSESMQRSCLFNSMGGQTR
ncbi:MAG: hypothetical protein M3552_12975, partial [Planctomycetota bacterium]|nr:hypothetical protein [Planctomycetota bacterium]